MLHFFCRSGCSWWWIEDLWRVLFCWNQTDSVWGLLLRICLSGALISGWFLALFYDLRIWLVFTLFNWYSVFFTFTLQEYGLHAKCPPKPQKTIFINQIHNFETFCESQMPHPLLQLTLDWPVKEQLASRRRVLEQNCENWNQISSLLLTSRAVSIFCLCH